MCFGSRFRLSIPKVRVSIINLVTASCVNLTMAFILILHISGAATTASRLGQPDLAIATMNDFVQVNDFILGEF